LKKLLEMKSLLILPLLLLSTIGYSQNYSTAIGLKGGYPGFGTLNIKHYLTANTALEGSLGGFSKAGLGNGAFAIVDYEINSPLESGFTWHYGGGALLGFTTDANGDSFLHTGINGLVGLGIHLKKFLLTAQLIQDPLSSFPHM
jgi:hypothetical protein